jgi:hypothetical protein
LITELTSLEARLDIEELKTTALETLTANHTDDIASNDTDKTALHGRLDIEEPKTTALQTLTASHTDDIALNTANILTKQDLIQDDYFTIAKTSNLQSSLDTNLGLKQDTISNFEINGNVNLDTTGVNFDTLVIRRVTGLTGYSDNIMNLTEIHIWVDDKNMLFESSSSLTSYIVSWSDKEVDIGHQVNAPPSNFYDDIRNDSTLIQYKHI